MLAVLEGALVLEIGLVGVAYFRRALKTGFSGIVLGLVVRVLAALAAVTYKVVPLEAFDGLDIEGCASVDGDVVDVVSSLALVEHCHGVVVVH